MIIEIPFFETSERKGPILFWRGYRAPVNIDVALRTFHANTRTGGKKKKKRERREEGKKNRAQMTAREERAVLERASEQIFSPRSPRAVDLAGLFSLLSVVRPIPSFSSGFFPSVLLLFATRFRPGRSVSGNTHAFPSRPRPTRRVVARSVHVRARAGGNLLCISLHRTVVRPPRGGYPFRLNYFINRVLRLKVALPPCALDGFSVRRRDIIIIVDMEAIFHFHA